MKVKQSDPSILLSACAYQIISQNFQRFVEQEEDVLKDKDPEPLHQMRVGMRRLRTALQVFRTAIFLPKEVNSKSVGKIAKSLGGTRDLDVLTQELIIRYQPLLKGTERAKFNRVLKHLHKEREQSFLTLKKTLNSDRYHQLKQAIKSWLEQPAYTKMGDLSVSQILPDLLLPLICQLFMHPGWLVGTRIEAGKTTLMPLENAEDLNQELEQFEVVLHDLRKLVKGVRYQAEFFPTFYADPYVQRIEEFKTIQDMLGQLQDKAVFRQFLESALSADLAQALPTVNQTMQQEQAVFWQNWQPLQQRYLSLEFRQSLRSLLTTPTEPVPISPRKNQKTKKVSKTN